VKCDDNHRRSTRGLVKSSRNVEHETEGSGVSVVSSSILQKGSDGDREGRRTVLKWVLLRWLGWSFRWSEITVDSAFKRPRRKDNGVRR
jgi:hypothetical protein